MVHFIMSLIFQNKRLTQSCSLGLKELFFKNKRTLQRGQKKSFKMFSWLVMEALKQASKSIKNNRIKLD